MSSLGYVHGGGRECMSLKRGSEDDYAILIDKHFLRLRLFIQEKKVVKSANLALRLMLSMEERKFDS